MSLTARDVMKTRVHTVPPDLPLTALDRAFTTHRLTGFPVVEDERLVGIVSRTDVVRQLSVEQSVAEEISAFYAGGVLEEDPVGSLAQVAARVGRRLEDMRVEDAMIHDVISVGPDEPVDRIARLLVERRIHRVPVVEDGTLLGILSSLDLVALLADGRAKL